MADLILKPQPVQRAFIEAKQKIVFFGGGGGGGKTWSILADNTQFIHDMNYFSVFFRNTTTELETNLWPEALKMYRPLLEHQSGPLQGKWKGFARIRDKNHEIIFPSGAKSRFAFLELDKHADSWYGSELSRVYFDECQKFSQYAYDIIRSRLRSKAYVESCFRASLNPDSSHWCYPYIKPFLDEEGFPRKELSGKTRYFLIVKGDLYTSWDELELKLQFPDKNPQTYTYIPSTLEDNKILQEIEPTYKDSLDALPEKKRKQMLLGCWAVGDDEGMYFQRNKLKKIKVKDLPKDLVLYNGVDTASEAITDNNRSPDWTYQTKIAKGSDGFYYIVGANRCRDFVGARNQKIINWAKEDMKHFGRNVIVVPSVDPGAAGKVAFQEFAKQLTQEGIKVKPDPMPNNKGKGTKYEPFSDAVHNGLVYICEELFDPEILEDWYRQSEMFDGKTRSTTHRKDDAPDSAASAFNLACRSKTHKPIPFSSINSPSMKAQMEL